MSLATKILEEWKNFDLEGQRNELDSQASTITEAREEGIAARKKLASTTREFKKVPAADKLKSISSLLKTYQQEIDRLTQRSKTAETAFLALYASLQHLTDPCIGLESAIEESQKSSSVGKLELENKNLRSQVDEFQREFKEIKNQEVTIRRLEDKLKDYENQMDYMVQQQLQGTAESIREEHIHTITQLKEREENLTHQLEQTKRELSRAVAQNEENQNKVLQEKAHFEEKLEAKQDELEYMADEINRVTSENERLKRDLGRARKELDDMNKGVKNEQSTRLIEQLEIKIAHLQSDLTSSQSQYDEMKHTFELQETNHNQELLSVKNQLLLKEEEAISLQNELQSRPTVEQHQRLKEKIKILKGIEGIQPSDDLSTQTKESLLQQKNKRLETQLVQTKEALMGKENEVEQLTVQLENMTEKSKQQKSQIEKLEQEVLQGFSGSNVSLSGSSDDVTSSPQTPRVDSMLKIVCTQRDRLQAKLQKLESTNEEEQQRIQSMVSELSQLRSDNVKLYQKIQYLESYNSKRKTGVRDLESGRIESKYKKEYEESVNPFVEFNRKERFSRYNQLSAAEKVTLTMGDFFLSNKFSRLFILIYTVILHLFIFVLMYKFAQLPSHCSDLANSF